MSDRLSKLHNISYLVNNRREIQNTMRQILETIFLVIVLQYLVRTHIASSISFFAIMLCNNYLKTQWLEVSIYFHAQRSAGQLRSGCLAELSWEGLCVQFIFAPCLFILESKLKGKCYPGHLIAGYQCTKLKLD